VRLLTSHGEQIVVTYYEALRSQILAGRIRGVRRGLAILLQTGMAAWMEAVSSCPPRAAPTWPSATSRDTRLPDERCPALLDILTNLVLNRFMEVQA